MLAVQRAAFEAARPEPLAVRRDRIDRLIALTKDNAEALCAAMAWDYGTRSPVQSMITDISATVGFADYCRANLAAWAKPQRRGLPFPLGLMGAKGEVRFEPKGVVGIISPWNFPVNLAFGPLAQVLAAGNRAMLKPSELTPATSNLIARLIADRFAADEVAVVTGGPDVAEAFSALPFDHLVFTGSTATGRKVAEAAARNLVPVTLELGGKSPVVIGRGADLERAGSRIVTGKLLNAGQICLSPDYLLVPEAQEDGIIAALELGVMDQYPTLLANPDYASSISDHHFARLGTLVEDARAKGARIVEVNPAGEDFAVANQRKKPLTLVCDATDDMAVMQGEIFGPVLPIVTYRGIDDAIARINRADRPLGLYYFGDDTTEREAVLTRTMSGGVTVGDVVFHVTAHDLPFGGVGPSGMGAYHGPEGFREFSHARGVYMQSKLDVAGLGGLKPPYGPRTRSTIRRLLGR